MEETKESRDTAATTIETNVSILPGNPPTTVRLTGTTNLLPAVTVAGGTRAGVPTNHFYPHSPKAATAATSSRKAGMLGHMGRPRSQSLNSGYNGKPLLVPQSPPPSSLSLGVRSNLSLSPTLRREQLLGGHHHHQPRMPGSPSMPPMMGQEEPPRVNDTQKAIEAAFTAERKRTKELEKEEATMTADELRLVLRRERQRMARFAADLAKLKNIAVQCQAESEIHEERCINGLMRRLESLQIEKGRIICELEQEEEMLTNTLQKKLNEVRREKAQLEKVIAQEQQSHSQMQTQLTNIRDAKSESADGTTPKSTVPTASSSTPSSMFSMGALSESPEEEEEEEEDGENIEVFEADENPMES